MPEEKTVVVDAAGYQQGAGKFQNLNRFNLNFKRLFDQNSSK
jgi:hypothetical protein